jgi:UDP-N-acetylmuramoylalanine--D-glutamate ligase
VPDRVPLDRLGRHDSWDGVRAVVAGFGVSGFAAADNLTHLGASVTALDESAAGDRPDKAALLEILGATVRLGSGSTSQLPDDVDVVVTSPGWRPDAPLLAQAAARGIPVWGEVELAWRLRDPDHDTPWLAVTGTNGKTTTVQMLERMLLAAGLRTVACGNVGLPIVEAVMNPDPYDVLAVELSSFQLHYTSSMRARSAAVLNVAEDHLDWYPSFDAYVADKARIYRGVESACVYNVADPLTEQLVRDADVADGARAIGFTLGTPGVGMVGVVDDVLVDRAFVAERQSAAAELCTLADLASPAPHFVANALAAAALAKGASFDDLVVQVRDRLRGVVLLGADAPVIAAALSRHAPDVPVFHLPAGETSPMDRVVAEAAALARPGDTVLLAPGCASMDMFADYAARGDAFVAAVHRMRRTTEQ